MFARAVIAANVVVAKVETVVCINALINILKIVKLIYVDRS